MEYSAAPRLLPHVRRQAAAQGSFTVTLVWEALISGVRLSHLLGWLSLLACSALPVQGQTPERVLRIGSLDGSAEYAFGGIADIDVFPDGRILVLDAVEKRLRVYDPSGIHLFSSGHPGEGPGEFLNPASTVITSEAILVYDTRLRRMVSFGHHGEHVRSERFWPEQGSLQSPTPLRFGKWISSDDGTVPGRVFMELMSGQRTEEEVTRRSVFLLEEPQVDTVFRFRPGWIFWYEVNGRGFGPTQQNGFDGLLWAVSGDSLVVSVDAVRGTVRWHAVGPEGLAPVAERDLGLRPKEMDQGFLEDLAKDVKRRHPAFGSIKFVAPEYEAYFKAAVVGPDGGVWLTRGSMGGDPSSNGDLVLVPMTGGDIHEVSLPARVTLKAVRDSLLYCVAFDELDVSYVEVYRYGFQRSP